MTGAESLPEKFRELWSRRLFRSSFRRFVFDGKLFVTDGIVAMMSPSTLPDTGAGEGDGKKPGVAAMPWDDPAFFGEGFSKDDLIVRFVLSMDFAEAVCGLCTGSGRVEICPECGGAGWVRFASQSGNRYESKCKVCGGRKSVPVADEAGSECPKCRGFGKNMINPAVSFPWCSDSHGVNLEYLRRMWDLSGFALMQTELSHKGLPVYPFVFDEGRGFLAAMRPSPARSRNHANAND